MCLDSACFLGVATITKDPGLQASHWLVTEYGSQVGDRSYGPSGDDDLSRDCSNVSSSVRRGPAYVAERREVKYRGPGNSRPKRCSGAHGGETTGQEVLREPG